MKVLPRMWKLYKENVKDHFTMINQIPIDFMGSLALIALPITLTVILGPKTLIDFFTRKPLTTGQNIKIAQQLETLDEQKLNTVVHAVGNYYPTSEASSQLRRELIKTQQTEQKSVSNETRRYEIRQLRMEKFLQPAKTAAKNGNETTHGETTTDNNKVVSIISVIKETAKQERIQQQRQLLCSFFRNPINDGKKTQHIICDAINSPQMS